MAKPQDRGAIERVGAVEPRRGAVERCPHCGTRLRDQDVPEKVRRLIRSRVY